MVFDPWTMQEMARLTCEQWHAEAAQQRLAREAQAGDRSVRVVVAQALRALAARIDGDASPAQQTNRRLVGA